MSLRGMAVVTVLVAAALTPSMTTATASTTVKVLQLNLCHSGIVGCYTGDRVLSRAVEVVGATHPQVLSVNEACAGDVGPLRAALGRAEAMFVPAENADGTPVHCRNGQEFGNIIMVSSTLAGGPGVSGRYTAQDTIELRVWACLPAGVLTACTTHLSSHRGPIALGQCTELMSRAGNYAAAGPVIVSGDFNLRHAGTPNVQDCNRPGFYRKGDGEVQHVFATTNLTFVRASTISMAGTTDHPAWLVTVSLP